MISENVRWTLRVSASSSALGATRSGQRLDPRDEVRLLGDVVRYPHALGSLDEDADGPVRDPQHPRHDAGDADVVEVVGPGLVQLRVARGDHHQHPLAGEDVVDQLEPSAPGRPPAA